MIARLWRDDALRGGLGWFAVTVLNVSMLFGVAAFAALRFGTAVPSLATVAVLWLGVALYLGFGRVRTRCGELDMTLPIGAQALWLSHLTAVGLVTLALAAGSAAVLALHHVLFGERVGFAADWPVLGVLLLGGALLAVVLLQASAPTLGSIPSDRRYRHRRLAVLAGVPLLLWLLRELGWVGAAVPWIAAAAAFVLAYRSLPASFVLAPLELEEPEARGSTPVSAGALTTDPRRGWRARSAFWLTLARSTSMGALEWLACPLLVVIGALLGSGLSGRPEDAYRIGYVTMVAYMLFALFGPRQGSLHVLDALPVSRRLVFAWLTLPPAVLVALSVVGGLLAVAARAPVPTLQAAARVAVTLALAFAPWLLLTAALLRSLRAGVPSWVRPTIYWGSLVVMMVAWLSMAVPGTDAIPAFVAWAVRLGGPSALGTLAAIGASAALLAGAYLLAERQFRRMEIPPRPFRYTLVDWSRMR